jgi:ankyrin repeat protein
MRVSAWGDWWEEKKEINLNYIRAAEAGKLTDVNKYLDNDMMLGKAADVNFKGLHDWTALHYAAENERVEIAKLLLK